MKNRKARKAMTFFLFTVLTLYSGVNWKNTFAWLSQYLKVPENTGGGAVGSYFDGGTGTETDPYIIKQPRTLYNLAWLQDLGYFNHETVTTNNEKRIKPTYFKLDSETNTIDMKDIKLPPIGTTRYPFASHFEGNNNVITNLTVTDDFTQLDRHPYANKDINGEAYRDDSSVFNCEIIGAFGVIGLYNYNKEIKLPDSTEFSTYTVSSSAISVSDVYFDNLTIKPKASKTLAGLLAGYVAGSLTTSGVCRGNIDFVASQTSITDEPLSNYTLVGDYNANTVAWLDRPGSMKGWGNSIEIETLFKRADLIYQAGSKSSNKNFYNQFYGMTGYEKVTSGSVYQPKGNKMYFPLRVSNVINNTYYTSTMTGSETIDKENNSGYLAGNSSGGMKIQFNKDILNKVLTTNGDSKTSDTGVTWENGKITDINFWTKRNSNSNTTDVEKAEDVYQTLFGDASRVSVVKQQVIDTFNSQISSLPSPTDSDVSLYSLQFTGDKPDQNQSICIPKAYIFGKEYTNFYMPCRTLSFTAFSDGYICLVGFNTDRDWASILNIYTHEITSTNNVVPLTQISTVTYNNNTVFSSSWGQLPRGKMLFYQIPITAGEHYAIGSPNNSDGMRILYLDLGLNGNKAEGKTGKVENIDFVYTDSSGKIVKIGSSGTVSTDYVFSDVLFKLESSTALNKDVVIYIKRTKGTSDDKVNYYASDSTLAVTIIGTQANTSKASDNSFYTAV